MMETVAAVVDAGEVVARWAARVSFVENIACNPQCYVCILGEEREA
jgi:hypothetical protein